MGDFKQPSIIQFVSVVFSSSTIRYFVIRTSLCIAPSLDAAKEIQLYFQLWTYSPFTSVMKFGYLFSKPCHKNKGYILSKTQI